MKKQILMLLAAAAVAGCTKSETVGTQDQNVAISLKTFVSKSTKATPTTTATLNSFEMVAYAAPTTVGSEKKYSATPFINLQSVTKDAEAWGYTGPAYWPVDKNLAFFAYSPKFTEAGDTFTPLAAGADNSAAYPSLTYTIKDVAAQQDLLAAGIDGLTATTNAGNVALNFKHLLSQVEFRFKGADPALTYTITSVKVNNVGNKGTFQFAQASGNGVVTGTWTVSTNEADIAQYVYFTGTQEITGSDAAMLTGTSPMILMPQVFNSAVAKTGSNIVGDGFSAVAIEYTVKDAEGTAVGSFVGSAAATPKLSDTWEAGYKYTYAVTLSTGAVGIKLVPTVDDNWSTGTTTGL